MAYQIPKISHPWRQWAGRKGKEKQERPQLTIEQREEAERKKQLKPIKIFLSELVENWEKVEVITTVYNKTGRWFLYELPEYKKAAWLSGILRRNYA